MDNFERKSPFPSLKKIRKTVKNVCILLYGGILRIFAKGGIFYVQQGANSLSPWPALLILPVTQLITFYYLMSAIEVAAPPPIRFISCIITPPLLKVTIFLPHCLTLMICTYNKRGHVPPWNTLPLWKPGGRSKFIPHGSWFLEYDSWLVCWLHNYIILVLPLI